MGWAEFPGEDESLPAPGLQAQVDRAEVSRIVESEGELPAVRKYVLAQPGNATLPPSAALRGYPIGYTCCATVWAGVEKVGGENGEMKNFYNPAKLDCQTEEHVRRIVDLIRRRERILPAPVAQAQVEAPKLDLEALAILTADYEATNMPGAATKLRRGLDYY